VEPADGHKPPAEAEHDIGARGPLAIVKRTERDFADWIATEVGFLTAFGRYQDAPIRLEPYQLEFLATPSRYRCVEKSRQVGYSWLFAAEAIARAHLRDTHTAVFVSYNLADSKEKIAYCAQLHEELPLAYQKKLVVNSKLELGFESNSQTKRVSRIISNPSKAPRGKKGDIYLDELAHYANDREVYQGSTALILRAQGQLTVCSSPLGRRGVFWEIARQELRPYPAYWRQRVPWWLCSFFCTDVRAAAREAPRLGTRERVGRFGTKGIQDQFASLAEDEFQQEFESFYSDEALSYYPYELILPCTSEDLELAEDFADLADARGRLVAGFDVGRRKDRSELAVFEESPGRMVCRMLRTYDRAPFAAQETDLRQLLTLCPIARLSIDQSGLGMHLAENLGREFPQVRPESFSSESKELWATDFKILLQRRAVVLPRDRGLVAQIHSIKKHVTPAGRAMFDAERDARGHADCFWAVALACRKDRGPGPDQVDEVSVRVFG
jgi:phage FluMu gp28-like protein